MKLPSPRPEVYDLYWKFAAERNAIFEKRLRGEPRPWTTDPILQTYKFCNTFRAVDRVSQYGIEFVSNWSEKNPHGYEDIDHLLQIVAFRLFNRSETWGGLVAFNAVPTRQNVRDGRLLRALEQVKKRDGKLFGNAFIICATNAFGEESKHANRVKLLDLMFNKDSYCAKRILEAESLEAVYNELLRYPLIGPFTAYQIAIDINYSPLINFSENDFTKAGPGALRGLAKCFTDLGDFTPEQTIHWMVERQDEEFERLGLEFNGLFGRKLHAIDAQGLFCETDKYCREAVPTLASERVKIKAKYKQDPSPYTITLPPKWGLGDGTIAHVHGAPEQKEPTEEWL